MAKRTFYLVEVALPAIVDDKGIYPLEEGMRVLPAYADYEDAKRMAVSFLGEGGEAAIKEIVVYEEDEPGIGGRYDGGGLSA